MKTSIREQKIISILESRGEMDVKALSEILDVSVRLIRYYFPDGPERFFKENTGL